VDTDSSSFGVGNVTQNRKSVHKTRHNCLVQNFATDSETPSCLEILGKSAPVANRNRPIPSRRSAERFKGEPAGSRHSSNGSSKPESHSKVEEVILKQFLNESGIRVRPSRRPSWGSSSSWVGPESGSGKWVRLRFREIERSEREAAIPCEERKWWRRGKIFALELELEFEDRESGVEEAKRRRRSRRSWEITEESKAANFRESMFFLLFSVCWESQNGCWIGFSRESRCVGM